MATNQHASGHPPSAVHFHCTGCTFYVSSVDGLHEHSKARGAQAQPPASTPVQSQPYQAPATAPAPTQPQPHPTHAFPVQQAPAQSLSSHHTFPGFGKEIQPSNLPLTDDDFNYWLQHWPSFDVNEPTFSAPPQQQYAPAPQAPILSATSPRHQNFTHDYIPFSTNTGSDADAPGSPDPYLPRIDSVLGVTASVGHDKYSARDETDSDHDSDSHSENESMNSHEEDEEMSEDDDTTAGASEQDTDEEVDNATDDEVMMTLSRGAAQGSRPNHFDDGTPQTSANASTQALGHGRSALQEPLLYDPKKRKATFLGSSNDNLSNDGIIQPDDSDPHAKRPHHPPDFATAYTAANDLPAPLAVPGQINTQFSLDKETTLDWNELMGGPYDGTLLP